MLLAVCASSLETTKVLLPFASVAAFTVFTIASAVILLSAEVTLFCKVVILFAFFLTLVAVSSTFDDMLSALTSTAAILLFK